MTISYTLYLAADRTPKQVSTAVRPAAAEGDRDEADRNWFSVGPVSTTTWRLRNKPALAEDNGVDARIGIEFQLIAEESEEAKPVMIRLVSAVLSRVPGDALLHNIADKIELLRQDGRLRLNRDSTLWSPDRQRLLPAPLDVNPL